MDGLFSCTTTYSSSTNIVFVTLSISSLRDGQFDIRGGGDWDWDIFEKNSLFPNMREKNKMSSTNKKFVLHSVIFFQSPLPWEL